MSNQLRELKRQREDYVKKNIGEWKKPFDYKLKLAEFDKEIRSLENRSNK